ncbi:transglutaminaseTgpA domain-containing protein [Cryobacterium sp. SO2]|uniref:transglutaminase-like domain-containing protein n=1 Tax=Cryobacterium sp. SO2 TaxID=1897060 RepID=UPI00223DC09B|nr:transglutaminase domain-containing protein [Cryobacterium sp. SO2]WEO78351.1 transglutaminaseTgpA domain-containing protein [Cryobacterium sp. SO2]
MRAGFVLGNTVAVLVATAVAAGTLWPVYQSGAFVLLVAVAALLGSAIAIAGALFRWPAWLVGSVTIGTYLVVGVPLAVPGLALFGVLPSAAGLAELLPATALAWKQLVTIVLPVGDYQALLVPALILVLLTSVIALSVALRAAVAEFALLAPIVLFLAGIALGPSIAEAPTLVGLGLFTVLVVWLLGLNLSRRRRRQIVLTGPARVPRADRRAGAVRSVGIAAAALLVAAAVGSMAAGALPPTAARDVLRTRVVAPFDARAYPSPLSSFRAYLQPDLADTVLFDVTGLPAGGRIRLATLDDYDGVVYSVGTVDAAGAGADSGSFTRLPYRLDQSAVPGQEVTLSVTIEAYSGVWVPGVGALEQIDFGGDDAPALSESFVYNDLGGTGAVVAGLGRGDSYTLTTVLPASADELAADLADARPGTAVLPPIGVLPDGLEDTLAGYLSPGDSQGQALQAMLEGLAASGYVSHGAADEPVSRSGHGADRISQLLAAQPMLGDAEQYAVTAALMARQIGFPARVVMGFAPTTAGSTVEVTGADVSAWIEIQTQDDGWVALDPTPAARDIPDPQPNDLTPAARPQTVLPPPIPDTDEQVDQVPPELSTSDPAPADDPFWDAVRLWLTVAAWTLAGLGILLAPFLAIVAAKAWRRRRRRRASLPLTRIIGGWQEFADSATDHGIMSDGGATRAELSRSVGGVRAEWLAAAVDRAAFAPNGVAETDPDDIWVSVRELRASFAAASTRRDRLRAAVSLRSFGRYAKRTTGRDGRQVGTLRGAGGSRKGLSL